MGKGKIGSQCAHAVLKTIKEKPDNMIWKPKDIEVYEVYSEEMLNQLREMSINQKLHHGIVKDAGRTEIAAGTRTVIGILIPLDKPGICERMN